MEQSKATDTVKKEITAPATDSKSKSDDVKKADATVTDTKKSDTTSPPKKDDKKEDEKAGDTKKDGAKKDESKPPIGPTLEELALQQAPTLAEQQVKDAKKKVDAPAASPTASVDKKADVVAANRLEEIAAQQQLIQQAQQNSYRVDAQLGPQTLYHPSGAANDPTSLYRNSNPSAPYTPNTAAQQLPQRGGVVTQYERSDLARTIGRSAADELLERSSDRITGDKGLKSMYHRNKDF